MIGEDLGPSYFQLEKHEINFVIYVSRKRAKW